jgi:periplasmic protein TonB
MAYADQQMSGNRITALIIVALIHIVLGYALVTGLAYSGAQAVIKKLTTVDIKEEVKKEEPPPPPKKDQVPPPIVAPPPPMNINAAPPPIQTVAVALPPPPVIVPIAIPAPAAPPAPPPPKFTAKNPSPKGSYLTWATTDDYPTGATRREEQGSTRIRVTVGPDGRVSGCTVTGSSGSAELDSTTCALITRRGRFSPGTDGEGNPVSGTWTTSIRWVLPKE